MGQSASTAANFGRRGLRYKSKSTSLVLPMQDDEADKPNGSFSDYISDLPDECLACIFQSLTTSDRKRCSLVCWRWLRIEGQSRHRLSLNAQSDLVSMIPNLFSRFDAVTKLALKCDRRSASIGDDALVLISLRCRNLTRLKLRSCRDLTDAGMSAFAKNCRSLKKLSCGSCAFGAKGMNAILDNCVNLEELSVKRLRGITDGTAVESIGPGVAAASLKSICLKELYNGQCFGPLIIGAKNLRTLKLFRCSGDWDKILQSVAVGVIEIHLERVQVSDVGLAGLSNCLDLEILHLVKTPECTDLGLISIAERCKLLRKLHIDGWKANRIGDEGLISVAKCCPNLQELVLIGVNSTKSSLEMIASNCQNLERLALCSSDTVSDTVMLCISTKCTALKKLCIKGCPVSNQGMEALAHGFPNLVKAKVKKCRGVTSECADWLKEVRGSLAFNLDSGEPENVDASASDGGAQDNAVEFHVVPNPSNAASIASGRNGRSRSRSFKARLGLLRGRNFVVCTLRRLSSGNNRR